MLKFDEEKSLVVKDEEWTEPEQEKEHPEGVEMENEYYEENEIRYDEPVDEKELKSFKAETEEKIGQKAAELGVRSEQLMAAAQLDLDSLDGRKFTRGEFEFIRHNLDSSTREIWESKVTGNKYLPPEFWQKVEIKESKAYLDRLVNFIDKHPRAVSLLELATYVSAWGPAVFKDLAGNHGMLHVGDKKITMEELASNPDLLKKIDKERSMMTPLDISQIYSHGHSSGQEEVTEEDISQVAVVALDELPIKDAGVGEALAMEAKMVEKYRGSDGKINDEDWEKASRELDEWSKTQGYENFTAAYNAESAPDSATAKFQHLKFQEKELAGQEGFGEFSDAFLKALKKHYTLEEVRKISEEHPEQAAVIIAEVLNEETDYDLGFAIQQLTMEILKDNSGQLGNYVGEKWKEAVDERNEDGIPNAALERGEVICWEKSVTYVAAKAVLENAGIPLEKLACFTTTSLGEGHELVGFAAVSSDGKKVLYAAGDPTRFEKDPEKGFDARDDWHFYQAVNEESRKYVDITDIDGSGYHFSDNGSAIGQKETAKAHKISLEMVKRHNVLVFQEELKKDILAYDPETSRKNRRVTLNKEAYEVMKAQERYMAEKEKEKDTLLAKFRHKIFGNNG